LVKQAGGPFGPPAVLKVRLLRLVFPDHLLDFLFHGEFEAHVIVEGGTGDNPIQPILELADCWMENGPDGNVPNILISNSKISKLTIVGGIFYTDQSPNVYSQLNPCAETITVIGALFEHNAKCKSFNLIAPTQKLVSIGNTYNWHGIDKTNVTAYLIFDRDSAELETNTVPNR